MDPLLSVPTTDHASVRPTRRAFTLVEILIVVVILAILASITFTTFGNAAEEARISRAQTDVRAIQTQVSVFGTENSGQYPPELTRDILEGWFGKLRAHPFSDPTTPLGVENDASNDASLEHPASKTMGPGEFGYWYNPANGFVRCRVRDMGDAGATLNLYNTVNSCNISDLAQTN